MKIINETPIVFNNLADVETVIEEHFKEVLPPSLKGIIITDPDSYNDIVKKYYPSENISTTNDGYYTGNGITISYESNGTIITYIVMIHNIFLNAIEMLHHSTGEKYKGLLDFSSVSLTLFLHEIGHSVDYYTRYTKYGFLPDNKTYNLVNSYEYRVYVESESMVLWSEFYAQYFSERIFPTEDKINCIELKRLLDSDNEFFNLKSLFNHCYRIGYYFALYDEPDELNQFAK